MKLKYLLVAGLCASVLAFAVPESAQAERSRDSRKAKTEELFPGATRDDDIKQSSRLATAVQKLYKQHEKEQYEALIEAAETLAANPKAGAYEVSQANYLAGFAAMELDEENYDRAIAYFRKAIDGNGLSNNVHYQTMQQLSQMLAAEERYEEALTMLDRFMGETKDESREALMLKGNVLLRMERHADAITALKAAIAKSDKPDESTRQLLMAAYLESEQPALAAEIGEQLAAENPSDKRALLNLVSIYMQADMPQKAGEAFDRMRAAKLLTESKDYENAYRVLANIEGREQDAVAIIQEGLGNGILQPSHEVYSFLGQSYYFSEKVEEAIAAWQKAAPLGKDGETYLNLAKVLVMEGRYAESKAAAQQALGKGVKKPGDAWMTIARAEFGDDGENRAGVLAAYREAAKYPETKDQALKQIQQMTR